MPPSKLIALPLVGLLSLALSALSACDGASLEDSDESDAGSSCGPSSGVVGRVIDGDTIELEGGEKIRYLMIDTPESTTEQECWGTEAKDANTAFVDGMEVQLSYDVECTDNFGRLLAYVSVNGTNINELMVERGHACVLHIPPNGDEVLDLYESLEDAARASNKGLWGACEPPPC